MKVIPLFTALAVLSACSSFHKHPADQERHPSAETVSAMFSPWQGREAFAKTYDAIARAKADVKVTVYSWSDSEFDKALETAVKNGVKVKVVMHPELAKSHDEKMKRLETLVAKGEIAFKIAPRNMHEKFTIVDGEFLVNSSANFSNGAKTKYSENLVFTNGPAYLIDSFENEFAVLWNSSKDLISSTKDAVEDRLPYNAAAHAIHNKEVGLYSSSMNYNYPEYPTSSKEYQSGRYIRLTAKGGGKGPYTVRDAIINAVNNAKSTIYCGLNHFNMKEIADALLAAAKRGVDVRLAVDNQEFKDSWRPGMKEMTPYFVENWKKIPGNADKKAPARVKFYSHSPNPANWLLNHHKFLVIDHATSSPVLLTGSHNLSETAEHNQFDNMVVFKGTKYAGLHKSFLDEFNKLWNWERTGDKPNPAIVSHFSTPKDGSLPLHHNVAVSLTWDEVVKLRIDLREKYPNFLRQINFSSRGCQGYNLAGNSFWPAGCAAPRRH